MVCLLKTCNGWVSCSTKEKNCHCKCQSEFATVTFHFKGIFWVRYFGLYLEILNSLTMFCGDNIFLICQSVFFTFIGPQQSYQLIIVSAFTGNTAEQTQVCNEHLMAPGFTYPMPTFQLTHGNWFCAKLSCIPAQIPLPTLLSLPTHSFLIWAAGRGTLRGFCFAFLAVEV